MFRLNNLLNRQSAAIKEMIAANRQLRDELDENVIKNMGPYAYLREVCTLGFQTGRQTGVTTLVKKMVADNTFGDRARIHINPHHVALGKSLYGSVLSSNVSLLATKTPQGDYIDQWRGISREDHMVVIFTEYSMFNVNKHRRNFVDAVYRSLAMSNHTNATLLFFSS